MIALVAKLEAKAAELKSQTTLKGAESYIERNFFRREAKSEPSAGFSRVPSGCCDLSLIALASGLLAWTTVQVRTNALSRSESRRVGGIP